MLFRIVDFLLHANLLPTGQHVGLFLERHFAYFRHEVDYKLIGSGLTNYVGYFF